MPSHCLNNSTPFQMLFHDKPLFSLKPKAFGYACFVHIVPLRPDKLSAKSVRCVFLGYAQNQKGYYCYSTTLKKAFISIDVTFFEDTPFYSSSTSPSCPTLYPLPVIDVPSSSPKRHADPPIVYTHRLITDPSSLPSPFQPLGLMILPLYMLTGPKEIPSLSLHQLILCLRIQVSPLVLPLLSCLYLYLLVYPQTLMKPWKISDGELCHAWWTYSS